MAMYLFYALVGTVVKFPNFHQPNISVDVYGGDFVCFTIGIIGECDIWYIIPEGASCQIC